MKEVIKVESPAVEEDDAEEVIPGVTKGDIKRMADQIAERDSKYGDFED
jgi:hypothetical protein